MAKSGNTNVVGLPVMAQLQVNSMATKCYGRCGACLYMGCFAQAKCAEIASSASTEQKMA